MDRATFFSESTKEAPASAALTAFSTGDWHNNKFIIEPFSIKNIIICNGGGGNVIGSVDSFSDPRELVCCSQNLGRM